MGKKKRNKRMCSYCGKQPCYSLKEGVFSDYCRECIEEFADTLGGYDHNNGMSNRAVGAYIEGKKPLSKFQAEDLQEYGISLPLARVRILAKIGFWKPCEWHHSSTWYNKVDFFDLAELAEKLDSLNETETECLRSKIDRFLQSQKEGIRVKGRYTKWGGSRSRPRKIGEVEFQGIKRGDWIYLDNGSKKKASGNHITYRVIK